MTDATVERSPMNDVETSIAWVCAARLEQAVGHEDFVTLVNTLVDAVRADERASQSGRSGRHATAPAKKVRFLTDADRAVIISRAASAKRTGTGKLLQGWADALGAELGLTKAQVKNVMAGVQ